MRWSRHRSSASLFDLFEGFRSHWRHCYQLQPRDLGGHRSPIRRSSLRISIIANYYDQLVRKDGRWKFQRHQIGGTPPAALGCWASTRGTLVRLAGGDLHDSRRHPFPTRTSANSQPMFSQRETNDQISTCAEIAIPIGGPDNVVVTLSVSRDSREHDLLARRKGGWASRVGDGRCEDY
jgi:hypothetical protein